MKSIMHRTNNNYMSSGEEYNGTARSCDIITCSQPEGVVLRARAKCSEGHKAAGTSTGTPLEGLRMVDVRLFI